MSWSVNAFGKSAAVKAKLITDLTAIGPMNEPEETAKQSLGRALVSLCDGNPGLVVLAEAHGQQWTADGLSKNSTAAMKFEVFTGFVE